MSWECLNGCHDENLKNFNGIDDGKDNRVVNSLLSS